MLDTPHLNKVIEEINELKKHALQLELDKQRLELKLEEFLTDIITDDLATDRLLFARRINRENKRR